MKMQERPGGCLPGLPIKLSLLGTAAPALPGDTLTVLADCAALLEKTWDPATVTVCPRLFDGGGAALRALADAGNFSRVRVVTADDPCCAALAEQVRRALPELPVEEARLPAPEDRAEETRPPAVETVDITPIRAETAPVPLAALRFYPVSAFTPDPSAGCAASLSAHFPGEEDMRLAAAILGKEAVFLRPERDGTLTVRSFSAREELQPGPETILSVAAAVRDGEKQLWPGTYNVRTVGGFVQINVGEDLLWIEHAAGPLRRMLEETERAALYAALGVPDRGTEIRPCFAGESVVLLELPEGEDLSGARPGKTLAHAMKKMGAAGLVLYRRSGEEETAIYRFFNSEGRETVSGRGAGLLGWWLPLLRRAGAECLFRQGDREYRTFTGPDGRLFLGGRAALGEQLIRIDGH